MFYYSICNFGSFKKPFATIISLSEIHFRFRRCILLIQTKKVIFMNYSENHGDEWKLWRWARLDLILIMRDIFINSNLNPLTKITGSSRSTEFKIYSHGASRKSSQKSRIEKVTVRGLSRNVNHLGKVIWDREIITEFTRSISSTRIG